MTKANAPHGSGRPEFMALLGLLPPYSADDVKQAYLEKVKKAHPDKGGNVADFLRLQEAFQRATEYVEFRASRMSWLASHMERYVNQALVVEQIEKWGGRVATEHIDWLKDSIGEDFSQVLETVAGIDLAGRPVGDEAVEFLVREHTHLHRLRVLDLSHTQITNDGLQCLCVFSGLQRLDIRGTQARASVLRIAHWFPKLQYLGVDRSAASLIARLRLRWIRPALALAWA